MPVPAGSPSRKPQPQSGLFNFVNNKGSKQPVKPTGRHAVALGPQATRPQWNNFKIKIHVRSFAPPQYFALRTWVGDNRGFTTSTAPGVTSRLATITTYYVATQRYLTEKRGSRSIALYGRTPLYANSDAYITGGSDGNGSGSGTSFDIHLCGNDKAVIPYVAETIAGRYQSPDIDVHTSLTITTRDLLNGTHLLSITGQMKGDQFPAAEAFVDIAGVKVFLGVSPARYNPQFAGPFLALFGDRQATMTALGAQIIINPQGQVMGVVQQGRSIDVDTYNQPFFAKEPTDYTSNQQEMNEMRQNSSWSPAIHW